MQLARETRSLFHRVLVLAAGPLMSALAQSPCTGSLPADCCATSSITVTGTLGPTQPPSSAQVLVDKFDPALGTLSKVEYAATIAIPNTPAFPNEAHFENTNPSVGCTLLNYAFRTTFLLNEPTSLSVPGPLFPVPPVFDCQDTPNHVFGPYDGVLDGQGPSGYAPSCPAQPPQTSPSRCRDLALDLAAFTRTAPGERIGFGLNTFSSQTLNSTCNSFFAQISTYCQVTITVTYTYCTNRRPIASDDTAAACLAGPPVCIDVLANDVDPEGQLDCASLAIVVAPPAATGTVAVVPGCCITFTPAPGFAGATSFEYRVSDASPGCSDSAIVTVQVGPCATGTVYCAGDGSATACPCGNASAPSAGQGCANSGGLGGELRALGVASLSADTLRLDAQHLTRGFAVFTQGTSHEHGGLGVLLGDGLLCVGGDLVRLGANPVASTSARYPLPGQDSIHARGALHAPGTRFYQALYRNAASFCTPASFNLTNGLSIDWGP
ncbi:MAG: choice-of-anchor E domain-containing protein [Planctomycetes bacterium]|nr:choice-of-anchor E domain-containing protein [Planctomycetota bacterium]